jgi:hypothetical protein
VDAAKVPQALAAGTAAVATCGLRVDGAVVVTDSNRLAIHLRPCDVIARVASRARQNCAEFEVELARRLAVSGAPVAPLDPRVDDFPNGRAIAMEWIRQLRTALVKAPL